MKREQIPSKELERLRDRWADQAAFIVRIYGVNTPEELALRCCICDLFCLIQPDPVCEQ